MDKYTLVIKEKIRAMKSDEELNTIFNYNKGKLINSLLVIITEEFESFSYDSIEDITYLYKALKILDICMTDNRYTNTISTFLDNIHSTISRIIIAKEELNKNSPINRKRYIFLVDLLAYLENGMNNYKSNKYEDNNRNYEAIISYVLFYLKDYNTFKKLLMNNKDIVNTSDKNGLLLIEKVVLHYMYALKNYLLTGNRVDLQFYNKVFYKILKNPAFRITDTVRKSLINKIEKHFNNTVIPSTKYDELLYYKNKLILGLCGDTVTDLSIENLNYEYGISDRFSLPILGEASKIEMKYKDLPNPSNNRRIYTFDHNPNEIDDGFSIERVDGVLIIGIHIANPTVYIDRNSIIMKEARNRTESIYIDVNEDRPLCIPMFPLRLSQDLMGLNADNNVYNMSFYYWYDEVTGELLKLEVKEEIIRVKYNFDYSEYDKIIKLGTDEELILDLIYAEKVANIIANKYDNSFISEMCNTHVSLSRGINVVTNLMIGNNMNMAQYFKDRGLPFAYRNHKLDEDRETLENLKKKVLSRDPVNSIFKMLNCLEEMCPNAKYSPICLGHDSLKLDAYSHTTSPLRRFVDILNLLCIKKFILGTYSKEDIKRYTELIYKITEEINSKRKFIASYAKEYEKRLVR